MRIKTIVIILITILFTVVLMQNTGSINFQFLWATFTISKLIVFALIALIAFVLGVMVGRPKRVKLLGGDLTDANSDKTKSNTLSDEDKDYIN
ncbi:MAG: hypothetical protein JWQ84_2050 [Mucilaginibacter sp.]|jgi:uncharacterized integral membrane protein|nr:hypothetical protein [Mucilaginibacter sp.]MDB5138934.1 hypothetical protein [Mucilaginibacter sp.]